MRAIACCLVLLAAETGLADGPGIVSSEPADGATGVAVDVGVIRIRFDRPMQTGSWTLWGSEKGRLPPLVGGGAANPFVDETTAEIRIERLEPDTAYAVRLNHAGRGRQGFRSKDGTPLPDTEIAFRTAPDAPAPRPLPPPAGGLDLGAPRPDPAREWTVLVYQVGDNNLEPFALLDLNEMEQGLPEKNVEILVLVDRAKGFDETEGDWTDARVYRVRRGSDPKRIESELLATPGETNMGDPRTLAGFVAAGFRAFPSRRHAVFLWNHGGGWSNHANDDDAPGSAKGSDELTLPELEEAMRGGLAGGGVERLDLVVFDMCLMGQLEIAVSARTFADVMVASEALEPGNGQPYDQVMPEFGSGATPAEIARRIVRHFGKFYEGQGTHSATDSALDLGKIPEAAAALDALVAKLSPSAARVWPALSRALFFSESYLGRMDFRNGAHAVASVDLVDAARRMAAAMPDFPAAAELLRLEKAVSAAVLESYAGARRRLSRGLAIYAPVRGDLVQPAYGESRFAKSAGWPGLLRAVHEAQKGELSPPKISSVRLLDPAGREVREIETLGGNHLEYVVEGKNILWTMAMQVKPLPEDRGLAVMYRTFITDPRFDERKAAAAAELADLVMPEYRDGRNVLRKEVGVLAFKVTDGRAAFEATVDYSDLNDLAHARVPAVYSHPRAGKLLVDIYFNVSWSTAEAIVGHAPRPDGTTSSFLLRPEPDAEVTPLFEVIGKDGKSDLAGTGTLRWGEGLTLLPVFQEPGQYAMVLEAESIGGVSEMSVLPYEQKEIAGLRDLMALADTLKPDSLVGAWSVKTGRLRPGSSAVEWVATPTTFEFAREPEMHSVLRYRVDSPGESAPPEGVALLDLRGAPCLIYFTRAPDGSLTRSDLHLVFRVRDEAGGDAFLLKDITLGGVYLLSRGAAGGASPLDGEWRSADGTMLSISGGRYRIAAGGNPVDEGTFRVEGSRLLVRSAGGESETMSFEIVGDRLTLTGEDGSRTVFTRAR